MADPVSWFLIEPGWKVLAADGTEAGKVVDVVGDSERDIFDGLDLATGALGKPSYVPAEKVEEITDGAVRLCLNTNQIEQLEERRVSFWQRVKLLFRRHGA